MITNCLKKNVVTFFLLLMFNPLLSQKPYADWFKIETSYPDSIFCFIAQKYENNNLYHLVAGCSDTVIPCKQRLFFIDSIHPIWFEYIIYDSIVVVEGNIENNKFNGLVYTYDYWYNEKWKVLTKVFTYKDNKKNGPTIDYGLIINYKYRNSTEKKQIVLTNYIETISIYKNGLKEGMEISYLEDGTLSSIIPYSADDVIPGKYLICRKNKYYIFKYKKNNKGWIHKSWEYDKDGKLFGINNLYFSDLRWYRRIFHPGPFMKKDCTNK